jgi:hypothetical protein
MKIGGASIFDAGPRSEARVRNVSAFVSDPRNAELRSLFTRMQASIHVNGMARRLASDCPLWPRDSGPASALLALGERETGMVRLAEATAACRAALEERTRDRVPLAWAITQNNLGNVLQRTGTYQPC